MSRIEGMGEVNPVALSDFVVSPNTTAQGHFLNMSVRVEIRQLGSVSQKVLNVVQPWNQSRQSANANSLKRAAIKEPSPLPTHIIKLTKLHRRDTTREE